MKKKLYLIAIFFPFFFLTSEKQKKNKKLESKLSNIYPKKDSSEEDLNLTKSFEKLTLNFSSKEETIEKEENLDFNKENKPLDSSMVSKNLVFPNVPKNLGKKKFIFAIKNSNETIEKKEPGIKKRKMGFHWIDYEEFNSKNLEIEDEDLNFIKKEKKIKK